MLSLREVLKKFLTGRGLVIATVPLLSFMLRLAMPATIGWYDLLIVLLVIFNWPYLECMAHKYFMHRWPLSLFYLTHKRHHDIPVSGTGMPDWWVVLCYPLITILWFVLQMKYAMTLNFAVFTMLGLYEFVHFSCHENYRPTTTWGWKMRVNHLMHHRFDDTKRFAMLFPGVVEVTQKKQSRKHTSTEA